MSTPIVPEADNAAAALPLNESLQLNPAPYAVEVFTDLERGKQIVTLHYRREATTRALADQLEAEVSADLARAGLVTQRTLLARVTKARGSFFNAYLEAPLKTLPDGVGDTSLKGLRLKYGKP